MESIFQTVKVIYNLFNAKREEENMKVRKLYWANRIKRRLKKRIRRFGNTTKKRDQTKERHSFLSVINFLAEPCRVKSRVIVKKFLKRTADHNILYSKFIHFHTSAQTIIFFYKNKIKAKKYRFEFLVKTWTNIVTDIAKNNSLSKSKKTSKLSKKIMGITEEEKIDILTLYLKSWETKHHIEFIKYRMQMNESGGENFDNENKISVLEYLYQEIEKVLFGKESNSIKKSDCDQKSSRREGEKKESTLHNSLTKPNNRQKGAWQAQDGNVKYKPPPLFR